VPAGKISRWTIGQCSNGSRGYERCTSGRIYCQAGKIRTGDIFIISNTGEFGNKFTKILPLGAGFEKSVGGLPPKMA